MKGEVRSADVRGPLSDRREDIPHRSAERAEGFSSLFYNWYGKIPQLQLKSILRV